MCPSDPEGARLHSDGLDVVCLCAEWCNTCREYRHEFERLDGQFPEVGFFWRDIEENAERLGDLEIENFPTILVRRREWVLFFGVMPPQAEHLRRLIETFQAQTIEQSRNHATSSPERSAWQTNPDLAGLGRDAEESD
ncbi:MAG: thioredoxin family protein [Candidatus Accumulibacter sp.]|jgi:thiol-disulfide isomerase/thioredoxin|nr:thioredoxin family protein [Accumulibacter sp.]